MGDIKFRAWNKTLNRMDNWNDLLDKNLRNIFIMKNHNGYEIMQYTGIKDKNGKEIYEGDILNYHNKITDIKELFVVRYCKERAAFILSNATYPEMTINVKNQIMIAEVIRQHIR